MPRFRDSFAIPTTNFQRIHRWKANRNRQILTSPATFHYAPVVSLKSFTGTGKDLGSHSLSLSLSLSHSLSLSPFLDIYKRTGRGENAQKLNYVGARKAKAWKICDYLMFRDWKKGWESEREGERKRETVSERSPLTGGTILKSFGTVKRPTKELITGKWMAVEIFIVFETCFEMCNSRASERKVGNTERQGEREREREGGHRERKRNWNEFTGSECWLPEIFPTTWLRWRFICFIYLKPFKIPSINYSR